MVWQIFIHILVVRLLYNLVLEHQEVAFIRNSNPLSLIRWPLNCPTGWWWYIGDSDLVRALILYEWKIKIFETHNYSIPVIKSSIGNTLAWAISELRIVINILLFRIWKSLRVYRSLILYNPNEFFALNLFIKY